jgi:hypothetical protein
VHHLFFGFDLGTDYESIAKLSLCNKKIGVINLISSAVCWGLWKLRNALCFQDVAWKNLKQLWFIVLPMIRCWSVLVPLKMAAGWLRKCSIFNGEAGVRAPADRSNPTGKSCCT